MQSSISPIVLILAVLVLGCKPDDPVVQLQDVNERGEYFNCYIDGRYWTFKEPEDWLSNNDNLSAGRRLITHPSFEIQASNDNYPQTVVSLWMIQDTFPQKDTVMLSTYSNYAYASIAHISSKFPDGGGSTDELRTGRIVFSKRGADRLEGKFYFDIYLPDSNRVFHITDGRFSVIPD